MAEHCPPGWCGPWRDERCVDCGAPRSSADLLEDEFRALAWPAGVLFAHTERSPASGWQQVAPGLLALVLPRTLAQQESDGRGDA